jgi:hypothetical protein
MTALPTILPGGCYPRPVTPRPVDPHNPSGCSDPRGWTTPAPTMPEHNCWDPRTWGGDQAAGGAAAIQH